MSFYHWSEDYVRLQISSAKGWAAYAAGKQMQVTAFGQAWQISGDGYVAQHRKNLLKQIK